MADAIRRLAAALSKLHGARIRVASADAIERCQNELERATLAVVGADHAGMLPECPACHGYGRRDLTPTEASTLSAVTDEWATTAAIRSVLKVSNPTLCNRLMAMEAAGVVESKRDDSQPRMKLWRRKAVHRG